MPHNRFKPLFIALLALFSLSSLFAAGEVHDGKVSAYLQGAYADAATVESKLKGAGFEIVGKDEVAPGITTVLFTCPTLKKLGSKPKRGFAAVMRAMSNKNDNMLSVTNPLYFERAYLQKEYDDAAAHKVLGKINTAFPGLKDSKDALKAKDLAGYHFTFGMPYYEDMDKVAKGSHNALLDKLKKSGKMVAALPLANGSTIAAVKLSDKTAKFIKKTGTQNALVLPYTVLIEGDAAYILAPKYYLALSYPQLSMSQFMKIATVPGKIEKECKKIFK